MPAANEGSIPRMRPPLTYVIDYSRRFIDDDANIAAFADAPPDLMHVGKTVPILHNWGPAPLLHGENQSTGGEKRGLNRDAIRLLTPKELAARIEMLKAYTRKWHAAGVPLLMPYSAIHTIAGDHETREGFWNFYDHWDDYAAWVGPKPAADPFTWLGVDKQGAYLPGVCGGLSPAYFAPLHRYQCCSRHPEWRKFQARLTELIAEVGYDGVFPDNSSVHDIDTCYCKHCQSSFRKFARSRSERELRTLGVRDPKKVDIRDPEVPRELLRRFRIDTVAQYQSWVRAAGRRVNPNFQVFPNVNSFEVFQPVGEHCDFLMFESTYMPGRTVDPPPPADPLVGIEVGESAAKAEAREFLLSAQTPGLRGALNVRLTFPSRARVGRAVKIGARIEQVGVGFGTPQTAEGFALIMAPVGGGRQERIELEPRVVVGFESSRTDTVRPPVQLSAKWTPQCAGRYRILFAHRHTDEARRDLLDQAACRSKMNWDVVYQTHVGQMLFTMHCPAQTVFLDYDCRLPGREAVQELGLAEGAAFSSGSTIASSGAPLKKYATFFRRARHLYEGFTPFADIALLYGYWGSNPETLRYRYVDQEVTPAIALSARARLLKTLMDRTVNAADLASLRTLILCGRMVEMSDEQIKVIRAFAKKGGELYLYRADATVNGRPAAKVFPAAKAWRHKTGVAGHKPVIAADGYARGLRFAAYFHPETRRMALHAVNYNVGISQVPSPVTQVTPGKVSLPLPADFRVKSVRVHDPDTDQVLDLPFKQTGRSLRFTAPPVRIYKVFEIEA